MATSEATTRRRVKLYVLNDERQWDDKGTGHVSALYTDQNVIALVVISENDGSCLLESKIQTETAYQKQQETLIVWSEGENVDLALSFQEKAGCDDIWEKICSVQGKDPSVEITQDVVDDSEDTDEGDPFAMGSTQSLPAFDLPPCELARLEDIVELVNSHFNILHKRERLIHSFGLNNYYRQLIDLFHKAEDLEDSVSLHHLYEIFRQLLFYNKQFLFDALFSDEIIMDVIGILEYNPAGRVRHREFLRNQARFREVLPINNADIISKIHQTYRIQYIQDCCLPPPGLFDEHGLSALKTFISMNKIEIINALQDDHDCMLQLFSCLRSPNTPDSQRRDLALFVKEFCNLSVATDQKENFLNCLSAHGALSTVEALLTFSDRDAKSAALEILQAFVENQPSVVREHVIKDNCMTMRRDETILINLMIKNMLEDPDPELGDAYQLGYMLRILIDPDNMNNTSGRSEKTEFLGFFYKHCIGALTKPLFDITTRDKPSNDTYHNALVISNVLDLLMSCIESHNYHMKNFCLHRDLVKRVLVLLRSTHKFLVLSALRLLRRVVQIKEEFYNRYLIKNHLFKPVIDLFIANGHRYNMVDSAVIELFEYLQMENITSLIAHVIKEYWDVLGSVTYVHTFKKLKEQYDASQRTVFEQQASSSIPSLRGGLNARFSRAITSGPAQVSSSFYEDDDEHWFNQDDDDDELVDGAVTSTVPMVSCEDLSPSGSAMNDSSREPPPPHNHQSSNSDDSSSSSSSDGDNEPQPKAQHHSPSFDHAPPYTLFASTSTREDESSTPVVSTHPSTISILIKSTSLGGGNDPIRTAGDLRAVKRLSPGDDGELGVEDNGKSHSKRPAFEDVTNDGSTDSLAIATLSNTKDETNKSSDIVGLVDYSDEDSDEEESVSTDKHQHINDSHPVEGSCKSNETKEKTVDLGVEGIHAIVGNGRESP